MYYTIQSTVRKIRGGGEGMGEGGRKRGWREGGGGGGQPAVAELRSVVPGAHLE
jgi:hypothetical protein